MKRVTGRMTEDLTIEKQVTIEVRDDATDDHIFRAIKEEAMKRVPNFRDWDVLEAWDPEDERTYYIDEVNGEEYDESRHGIDSDERIDESLAYDEE